MVATEGPELCAPCGRCRQQLAEFARPDVPVHLAGPEGVRVTVTLGELLPLAFGPETLGPLRPDAALDLTASRGRHRPAALPRS